MFNTENIHIRLCFNTENIHVRLCFNTENIFVVYKISHIKYLDFKLLGELGKNNFL